MQEKLSADVGQSVPSTRRQTTRACLPCCTSHSSKPSPLFATQILSSDCPQACLLPLRRHLQQPEHLYFFNSSLGGGNLSLIWTRIWCDLYKPPSVVESTRLQNTSKSTLSASPAMSSLTEDSLVGNTSRGSKSWKDGVVIKQWPELQHPDSVCLHIVYTPTTL